MKNSYKRLDAHLSSLGYCTRGDAKKFLKINELTVNGDRVFNPSLKAYHDEIKINGKVLDPESFTILMNKPSGVICSHNDAGVLIYSLLPQRWNQRNPKMSTIGRLDIDTTGAILITDDGVLNHRLTNPKKDISKVYEVDLKAPLKGDEEKIFASGELVLNGEEKPLLPAKLEVLSPTKVRLEIIEGKYHQVKRMFAAVGNRVVKLHRVSFDDYTVDDLNEGDYRIIMVN